MKINEKYPVFSRGFGPPWPERVLMGATVLWGGAFPVMRGAMAAGPAAAFVALRFLCAAGLVAGLSRPDLRRWRRAELAAGIAIGLAMLSGYTMLAASLARIGSGRAAFLAALYVPGVPLLEAALRRAWPRARGMAGAVLAAGGMMLMAGSAAGGFDWGEVLALGAAVSASAEIVMVGRFARRGEPRRLAVVQCLTVALLAAPLSVALGESAPVRPLFWGGAAVLLGGASAVLQLAANWALRFVPSPRAAVIFALEPVWAAGLGAAAGERMGVLQIAGAVLILLAMVISGGVARTEAVVGG